MRFSYCKLPAVILLLSGSISSFAQVSISTPADVPAPSAMLDVKSTNKGVLMPRVGLVSATDASTIPSPAISLMIYNTATAGSGANAVTPGYYYWSGSRWTRLSGYPVAVYESKTNTSNLISSTAGCSADGPTLMSLQSNRSIPDNDSNGLSDTINFTGYSSNVCDAVVEVRIDHPYLADLDLFLVAPDGTSVELSTDNGSTGDNYGTGTDPASYVYTAFTSRPSFPSVTTGTAPFNGFYQPEGSFSVLAGKPINGKWVLKVIDDAAQDSGLLLKWKLTLINPLNLRYVLEKEVPVTIQPGMQYLAMADYTAACRNPNGVETHLAWSSSSAGPVGTESVSAPANILHSSAAVPAVSESEKFVQLHNQGLLSSPPGSTVYFQLWRKFEVYTDKVTSSLIVQTIQQ